MDRDEFERCREAIRTATAALNAHLDTVDGSMFNSRIGQSTRVEPLERHGAGTLRWLAEYDRLVRIRDVAEADLATRL
jgi:hypothetical protein